MPETETNETTPNQADNQKVQPEAAGSQPPHGLEGQGAPEEPKKSRKPVLMVVGGIILVLAIIYGVRFYLYNRVHVNTDDAYITGDLVNVSPQINGNLQTLLVKEGDYVTKGQLIATLDPSGPTSTFRQVEANYQAALSQVPVAQKNLEFQKLATDAAVRKAQAALNAQQSKTTGARQQVTLTRDTVNNQVEQAQASISAANAQWQQSQAQVTSAKASRDNYVQAVQTSRDALANYQQQILTAQHAQQSAQNRADAAAALADRATKDAERFRVLYSEDAVSAQVYDQYRATAQNAAAQLDAARSDVQQSASQVESARRAAKQATSQVEQAKKNVAQADAQTAAAQKSADAAQQQVKVAQAGLGVAQANLHQIGIQESNLESTSQQTGEAEADIANAQSGTAQIAAREEAVKTAEAQAAQAKAAVVNAQITLGDTKIYSPASGEVVKKDANVGQTMSPGSTIVTLTRGNYVWVTANFKETQLEDVRVGQPAEIEVDAFGDKVFKGRVRNILEATGAATALLPPDNATGNFTKVVQRIPVRIELVPAAQGDDKKYATADDIRNLRQGMSVDATIDTSDKSGQRVVSSGQGGQGEDQSPAPADMGQGGASQPNNPGGDSGASGNQPGTEPGQNPTTPQGGQPNPNTPNGGQPNAGGPNGVNPGTTVPNPGTGQPGQPSANGQGGMSASPTTTGGSAPSVAPGSTSPSVGTTGTTAGNAAGNAPAAGNTPTAPATSNVPGAGASPGTGGSPGTAGSVGGH